MKIFVLGGSGLIGNFFIHNSINHEIITTFNIKFSSINEGIKQIYERRDELDIFNI
jgi:dihydrofolate reductase